MPAKKAQKVINKAIPVKAVSAFALLTALFASAGIGLHSINKNSNSTFKPNNTNNLVVKTVVDGDTIEIANGPFIRLMGVEASEKGFCYYEESKKYLADLIEGETVTLDFVSRGAYGRSNAFIYKDGVLLNKLMVAEGLARYEGSSKANKLGMKEVWEKAKTEKMGLWGECVQIVPPDSKCSIKGNIAINTNKKTYYFKGCSNYERTEVDLDKGESWFCSEKEAEKAGYFKSKSCYGKSYEK